MSPCALSCFFVCKQTISCLCKKDVSPAEEKCRRLAQEEQVLRVHAEHLFPAQNELSIFCQRDVFLLISIKVLAFQFNSMLCPFCVIQVWPLKVHQFQVGALVHCRCMLKSWNVMRRFVNSVDTIQCFDNMSQIQEAGSMGAAHALDTYWPSLPLRGQGPCREV